MLGHLEAIQLLIASNIFTSNIIRCLDVEGRSSVYQMLRRENQGQFHQHQILLPFRICLGNVWKEGGFHVSEHGPTSCLKQSRERLTNFGYDFVVFYIEVWCKLMVYIGEMYPSIAVSGMIVQALCYSAFVCRLNNRLSCKHPTWPYSPNSQTTRKITRYDYLNS